MGTRVFGSLKLMKRWWMMIVTMMSGLLSDSFCLEIRLGHLARGGEPRRGFHTICNLNHFSFHPSCRFLMNADQFHSSSRFVA